MRVTEGTSFELADGTWLKPEIEFGDEDFDRVMSEWKVSSERVAIIPLSVRYAVCSTVARLMLAQRQVSAQQANEAWVRDVGKPMLDGIKLELQGLYKQVTGVE